MKKKLLFINFLLFLVLTFQNGHTQNPLENEKEVFSNAADAEKIYLQLSGTTFNTSEIIWFKAIVTDVINHKPTTKSSVLHVELIDPIENQVVDKSLLKIENGWCSGSFQLSPDYREGKYVIRAYTQWNRNFGKDFMSSVFVNLFKVQRSEKKVSPIKDFVFTKDIQLQQFSLSANIAIRELDSLHKGDAMLYIQWGGKKDSMLLKDNRKQEFIHVQHQISANTPILTYRLKTNNEVFTKSVVLDQNYGSLQFFPEGGSMVEGTHTVLGFKFLNYKGRGAEIAGIIEDENKTKVAAFKSNLLGMGKVMFTPKKGRTYYGVITHKNGLVSRHPLPKVKGKGLVLKLDYKKSFRLLKLWNPESYNDSLYIKFFHRGKNLFYLKAKFNNGKFLYKIRPELLPQGVVGMTIYNNNFQPVAERHFFNAPKGKNFDIMLVTDKQGYRNRDSVTTFIETRINGIPASASVSLIAIDSSYFFNTNLDRSSIISYFLLQSDLKGKVENPSYYFQNDERIEEIDYLMLTHGWTNYKYKEKKKSRQFKAEEGLEVRGIVERGNGRDRRTAPNTELNMLILGDQFQAYSEKTNGDGLFQFKLNDSYGFGQKLVVQSATKKRNNDRLKIKIKKHDAPKIFYEMDKIIAPVDSVVEKKVIQKLDRDIELNAVGDSGNILLDEIVLNNYKMTPERAKMAKLQGLPDVVVENDELVTKKKNWTRGLYRWLRYNYSRDIRLRRVGRGAGFELAYVYGTDWTYIVIDGIPVKTSEYEFIGSIPVDAVKSVEILRNPKNADQYYQDVFECAPNCPAPLDTAILAIYTYSGNGLFGTFYNQKTNVVKHRAPQYTPLREFYIPDYRDTKSIDWTTPDRRTLLYWNPNVVTNNKGKTKVTFYNSDLNGKVLLICEGITINGQIGYSEWYYEVEER